MKRIKNIFILLLASSLFASCNLNILPDSSISGNSYWETEEDVKAAVNSLYIRYRSTHVGHKMYYWFEARTQLIGPGLTSSGVIAFNNNDITPNLDDTNWVGLYQIISQANVIIENIDNVQYRDPESRNKYLAEAYFFRAWCYFNLARLWGDVPIITNYIASTDDPQLYPERASMADVYDLIRSDINTADELYKSMDLAVRNRVSRQAILMLKTDIYLWIYNYKKIPIGGNQSDLKVAEDAVDEVLATAASTLGLMPTYSSVFDTENNNEVIFAIHYDIAEKTDQYGTLMAQSNTLVPANLRNNPIPVGNNANHVMAFTNLFDDNYRDRYKNYPERTSTDTRADYNSIVTENGNNAFRWTKKYMGEMEGNQRRFTTDTRVYRYAEALMFKAEILAERGDIAGAVNELNKVVRRAYNNPNFYSASDFPDVKAFKNTLLDERIIEFAAELKSWFDMIRFGEAFNRIPSLEDRENDKQGNILFLPVNNNTMNLNTKIKQTPGYDE